MDFCYPQAFHKNSPGENFSYLSYFIATIREADPNSPRSVIDDMILYSHHDRYYSPPDLEEVRTDFRLLFGNIKVHLDKLHLDHGERSKYYQTVQNLQDFLFGVAREHRLAVQDLRASANLEQNLEKLGKAREQLRIHMFSLADIAEQFLLLAKEIEGSCTPPISNTSIEDDTKASPVSGWTLLVTSLTALFSLASAVLNLVVQGIIVRSNDAVEAAKEAVKKIFTVAVLNLASSTFGLIVWIFGLVTYRRDAREGVSMLDLETTRTEGHDSIQNSKEAIGDNTSRLMDTLGSLDLYWKSLGRQLHQSDYNQTEYNESTERLRNHSTELLLVALELSMHFPCRLPPHVTSLSHVNHMPTWPM
ncbi:hypothetical protein CPB86DRAFT_58462 [Serendipita vermifera]|nr:hypothetical protein CPB86DRAFT_58462 [Serendipita vermifera]